MSRVTFRGLAVLLLWMWGSDFSCNADELPTCQPKDFHYEFTDCDESGGRWRVSVPTPGICTGGAPNAPIRLNDCNMTCKAGYFFNVSELKCQKCPMGTYSLGGGIAFDSWKSIPPGFHVVVENFQPAFRALIAPMRGDSPPVNCSQFGWQPAGDVIASPLSPCTSILIYTARLVKPGNLTYTYQYVDDNVVFQFQAQDEQCQSFEEAEQSKWPPLTEEGIFRSITIPLKAGLNVLKWRTIGVNSERNQHPKPVLIKSIEISGLAYASSCIQCDNGSYSGEGATACRDCPRNTYSGRGAGQCLNCTQHQYSVKGSAKCLLKLPCTENDYYQSHSRCDNQKQTMVTYKWIEPKICDDEVATAVHLLEPEMKACPPCNPGMHYSNSSSCTFCPKNHFSNGLHGCRPCPVTAAPNYSYQYTVWNELPSDMEASCMSITKEGCRTTEGWRLAGDHIHSGLGHTEDTYVVLVLKIPGFRTQEGIVNGRPIEVGKISFIFELSCSASCELLFMQESSTRGTSIIQSWNGPNVNGKQHYTYAISQNDTYEFSWIFWKHGSSNGISLSTEGGNISSKKTLSDDRAKIYSVNVTNTLDGGASECLPCPRGFKRDGCIPCPAGHYIDTNTTECRRCPPDTFVSESFAYGVEACKPCGPGLQSDNGITCYSDCSLHTASGHQYDFQRLAGFHQVQGSHLFTSSGTEYFHHFNLSLCGKEAHGQTICANNITAHGSDESIDVLRSVICRSTIIPMKNNEGVRSLAAQSISLGDHLIGVTTETSLSNITVIKEFIQKKSRYPDVHLFYFSPFTTRACPIGRWTTVTLYCDVSAAGNGTITLPPSCPDGTCDGCSFHFFWRSKWACPTCNEDDYEVVAGECTKGVQTIHYIAPNHCLLPEGVKKLENKRRSCSSVPEEIQIVIGLAALMGILLFVLVVYFWKKNRKLEYKYMKLVQSASSKDGELPPAESCGIHDDEEDQFDSVEFRESKGQLLLNKLRFMASTKDGKRQPFESLHLTAKDDLT